MRDPDALYEWPYVTVKVWTAEGRVLTQFKDGTELWAASNHTPEDREHAKSLGYESVIEMTLAHDLAHTTLAIRRGLPYSPVLWGLAHDSPIPDYAARSEEALVLAFQKWVQRGSWDPILEAVGIPSRELVCPCPYGSLARKKEAEGPECFRRIEGYPPD